METTVLKYGLDYLLGDAKSICPECKRWQDPAKEFKYTESANGYNIEITCIHCGCQYKLTVTNEEITRWKAEQKAFNASRDPHYPCIKFRE